jgi:hypothetical protein
MAAHRFFLLCPGALAIVAAVLALALQMLLAAGVAAAPGVAAGHSICIAAPVGDGAPAHPGQGPGCDSCLVCQQQQRGSGCLGLAFAPPAALNILRGEVAAEPFVSPVLPPERRAGRGGGSSRAPPAFG